MAVDATALLSRYDRMTAWRWNFDDRWERMAPFIAPTREGILVKRLPGEKETGGVFDSTGMFAAELFAQFIAGNVINPSQRWFGLKMAQAQFNAIIPVKEWLEDCTDRMLQRLDQSSFYAEAVEMLIDYGGFGTGSMMIEEAPQPINRTIQGFRGFACRAEKIGRYVIAEDAVGMVDTHMYERKLTASMFQARWGEDKQATIPEKVKEAIKQGHWDKPFDIVHAVTPRSTHEQSRGMGPQAMPWVSVWLDKASKTTIKESGLPHFNHVVPRYYLAQDEIYGRGRGDLAYPDIKTLNKAKWMGFKDWALKIQPPVLGAGNAVIGDLRLTPAGYTSIKTITGRVQDALAPYETGSHPEVSQIKEEELRQSIKQIFFVDQILAMLQVEKTQMTAYEFSQKLQLLFRLLGPVYGRMEHQFLEPLVNICFDLMFAAGAFSPPPQEVFSSDGRIETEFQNPLSKAQRSGDIDALNMMVQDLQVLGQIHPEMYDRIDPDKAAKYIAEVRGVPARVERSDEEMQQVRDERDQQRAQMEQQQVLAGAAQAAGKAAPMVKAMQGSGK